MSKKKGLKQPLLSPEKEIAAPAQAALVNPPGPMKVLSDALKLWDPNAHLEIREPSPSPEPISISSYVIKEDESALTIIYTYLNQIRMWSASGKTDPIVSTSDFQCLCISPDCKKLYSGHSDYEVNSWHINDSGNLQKDVERLHIHGCEVQFIEVNNDFLISSDDNKDIIVWSFQHNSVYCTLKGHSGLIISMKFVSGYGKEKKILTASKDKTLRLWDIEGKKEEKCFADHDREITCMDLRKGKTEAVTGSSDNNIRVWDLINLKCVKMLDGHKSGVICVKNTPDDRSLVSADLSKVIMIWDGEKYQCLRMIPAAHDERIKDIATCPGEKYFFSCSTDKSIKLWNIQTGEEGVRLIGDREGVEKNGIFNGKIGDREGVEKIGIFNGKLVSRTKNKVAIWELVDQNNEVHKGEVEVKSICMHGEKKLMAIGNYPKMNSVSVYSLDSMQSLYHKPNVLTYSPSILTFSPNGKFLAIGSEGNENNFKIVDCELDLQNQMKLITLNDRSNGTEIKKEKVNNLAIANNGTAIAGFNNRFLEFWSATTQNLLTPPLQLVSEVSALLLVSESTVLVGLFNSQILLYDFAADIKLCHTYSVSQDGNSIQCLVLIPSSIAVPGIIPQVRFASGSTDGKINIWSLPQISEFQITTDLPNSTFSGHSGPVTHLIIAGQKEGKPGNLNLISAAEDKLIIVWDLQTGKDYWGFTGHTQGITSLQVKSDTNLIVSSSMDSSIRVWNIKEKREEATLVGHQKPINALGLYKSGGSDIMVSFSADHTWRVWKDCKEGDLCVSGATSNIEAFCALYTLKKEQKMLSSLANITVSKCSLNFAHFFANLSLDTKLQAALESGCKIYTDEEGNSPFVTSRFLMQSAGNL